jgi:5-methylthioadenosine/S-adenosylhomocysteine deaminase
MMAQISEAAQTVDTLVLEALIVTMDAERRVIRDGGLAVRGDRIVDIGKSAALRERYRAGRPLTAAVS